MNTLSERMEHRKTRVAIGIAANVAAFALILNDMASHAIRLI